MRSRSSSTASSRPARSSSGSVRAPRPGPIVPVFANRSPPAVAAMLGAESESARTRDAESLLNYGFRFYESHRLYGAGKPVTETRVWQGAQQMLPVVHCRARVTVDATCQRCLEAFRLPLEVEEDLLLLGLDETVDGYDEYEVWELEDALLRPQDIVEELLIMAVPFAPMHTESAACRVLAPAAEATDEELTTPFAALREQMARDNESSD